MRWFIIFLLFIPITVTGQQAECNNDKFTGNIDCFTPLRAWYITEGETKQIKGFWSVLSGHEGYNLVLIAKGDNLRWKTGDSIYFLYDGSRLEAKYEIISDSYAEKQVVVTDSFDWLAAAGDVQLKIRNTEVFVPDKAIEDLRALKKLLTQ